MPRESSKTPYSTGCLPRVSELFEARKPKDYAIISEIAGRVEFGKDYKTKRRIVVVPEAEDQEPREYLIPKGKHISVQEGDFVQVGDMLLDGNPVPHDILDVLGVEALANYLIDEIQRSEEHTSELQSLMRISYAVFCLQQKTQQYQAHH